MLLLAADTSGKHGTIALAQCAAEGCDVIEVVPLEGGTFSAQLVPQIAALLAKHGFNKTDIGGFAVASGPGSFTGVRVGLAAIKALAEVRQLAPREGWCYQHVQAIIVAVDQYAEAALGNRDFFLNKPYGIGGGGRTKDNIP